MGRETQLWFNDFPSGWYDTMSGIGQGDPLLMILYTIYNADLVNIAKGKKELTLTFIDNAAFLAIGDTFIEMETH
ncbi:hypothetical protein ID866_7530 [Astraeus odoratus]|nr:hypothetical protein ID866_7530 [Astraeus odoratus]